MPPRVLDRQKRETMRVIMRVQDLMTADVETLHPGDSAADVLDLLHERNIRHVPVVDRDGDLVGLVTHRDVLRNTLSSSQSDLPQTLREEVLASRAVESIMTKNVLTAGADDLLAEAAQSMLDQKVGCVLVTEGRRLVGILTEADFVRHVAGDG